MANEADVIATFVCLVLYFLIYLLINNHLLLNSQLQPAKPVKYQHIRQYWYKCLHGLNIEAYSRSWSQIALALLPDRDAEILKLQFACINIMTIMPK